MRHRAITILAALFCLTLAYAGNLSVEPLSLKPGETKELKFSLSSSAIDMSGVQFDMTLPEGFVLKSYSDDNLYMLSAKQPSDLSCTVNNLDSDTYRFMLYSNTLQKLNEGELIRLNLQHCFHGKNKSCIPFLWMWWHGLRGNRWIYISRQGI